jgi:transposase
MKEGKITLSQKQLKTYTVINKYIEKSITRQHAAELLGISTRQISRLKKGVQTSGAEFLIHKNTGRKPAHAFAEETKEAILTFHSLPEFAGVNFLHFQDILADKYQIKISYSSLTSILKNAGIQSPKKKKIKYRTHRRKRKHHPGQLIQIDATPFEWFGDSKKYALHGAIDDATGQVVGLYMTQNECLFGYFEMMRQCCLDFGVPQTLYSDNHTIFRSPKTRKLSAEELIAGKTVNLTQFGRSMHELGIDMLFAKTPQAKGRIERLWDTLQSRLPVELAMKGIKTVEEANVFLEQEYRFLFNQKFAVPAEGESLFVALTKEITIDEMLCIKQKRKTDHAGSFSFQNRCFQILDLGFPIISSKKEIDVLINPRFGIKVAYKGRIYDTIRYIRPQRKDTKPNVSKKAVAYVEPHLKHSTEEWKKIWWQEDYNLSLKFLYELFFEKQQSAS